MCVDILFQLNSGALHRLSTWYARSLRSLWWVDSLGSAAAHCLVQASAHEQPDPLVMAAWRCSNLEEIILLGNTMTQLSQVLLLISLVWYIGIGGIVTIAIIPILESNTSMFVSLLPQ